MGFVLNKCDPCVANRLIDGSQCTVTWYVDDSKVSHIKESVVSKVIKEIEESFEKMSVSRGKSHVFVGMNFKINDDRSVGISMSKYLKECIATFGEEFNEGASTPARADLFNG